MLKLKEGVEILSAIGGVNTLREAEETPPDQERGSPFEDRKRYLDDGA